MMRDPNDSDITAYHRDLTARLRRRSLGLDRPVVQDLGDDPGRRTLPPATGTTLNRGIPTMFIPHVPWWRRVVSWWRTHSPCASAIATYSSSALDGVVISFF